jgi:hypothetical protein
VRLPKDIFYHSSPPFTPQIRKISNKNKFRGNNVDCCNFDCNLNLTAASHFITAEEILNEITLSTIKKLKRHQKQFKCIKAHGGCSGDDDGRETHGRVVVKFYLLCSYCFRQTTNGDLV